MNQSNYINNVNFIRRGFRCHGISIKDTTVIFIRRIRSWTLPKFRKFLEMKFPDFNNSIVAVKHTSNINDNLYQIKTTASTEEINVFIDRFKEFAKKPSINVSKCSRRNHKSSFFHIRRKLCHTNNNLRGITYFSNYNNSTSSNDNLNEFSFCLSWNTNGWNNSKKDGIQYFNKLFKPLFICFQETGNDSDSKNLNSCKISLPNYKFFCKRADNTIPGLRGLYIFYNRSLQTSIENNSLNYIISITTYCLWNNSKCSIGNIYIPHKGHSIHHKSAKMEALTWFSHHSHHPSILLGDYNIQLEDITEWISNLSGWSIVNLNGSPISWSRGTRCSAIDHAIINDAMKKLISSASIIDFPPISDHKPLLVFGNFFSNDNTFSFPKKPARWNRIKCLEESISIATSNKFSILLNECDNKHYSANTLCKKFVSTAESIAQDLDITSTEDIHRSMLHMSSKIFELQRLKVQGYKDLKKLGTVRALDDYIKLINNYQKLCDQIHKKCNHFRKLEYLHWVKIGCQLAINKDSRNWWKWIKKNSKMGKSSNFSSHPIKDKDDNIVYSSPEQLNIWHDHYEQLASDPTGHSLYKPFWSNPANKKLYKFRENDEWDINGEISIEEIRSAISSIPNFKASGPDNIPVEFYKAIITDLGKPDDSSTYNCDSILFLHLLFNRIWDGDFPDLWNKACIVSIPKKGDLSDCNNYRGISLINNIIKIISKIVTTRISDYAIKHNLILPEQFGFRNKEECISLFISIRNICQTRKNQGDDTYLAFLDLKKAYDSVPIYNILNKLECLGIRGKCYKFLENLYLTSKACVKLDSQFSEAFRIKKGVRQGCPLSPILFNLFINDIFRDCNKLGVPIDDGFCCGGLFADDIVLCAPTRSKLNKLLRKVNNWAKFNRMDFGITKCATMVVRAEGSEANSDPTFYLSEHPIPKTNCYTYLGIPFDSSLSLKPIIKATNNKVRKALFSVKGFLINPCIPITFKELVFKSVVISQVSYVAPLLGSNKVRSNGAQKLINKGLSWIGGFKKRTSFISLYNLSKDLNIPPLSAKCALAQVRCFRKWANSNCIISNLVNKIPKMRKYTWTKESRTLSRKLSTIGPEEDAIYNFFWNRDVRRDSIKAVVYSENSFESSRDYLKLEFQYPNLAYGFNWLLKIRCGYKFNSEVAKAAKLVSDSCPDYCPCCQGGNQTFEHWIFECPAFNFWRTKLFGNFETIYEKVNRKPLVSFDNNNINNNSFNSYSIYYRNNNNFYLNNNSNNNINNNNENTSINHNSTEIIDNLVNNLSIPNNNNTNSVDYLNNSYTSNRLDNSYNNLVSNFSCGINFHSNELEWRRVYYFLLGGRVNYHDLGNAEWRNLCKAQIKPSSFSDVPLMVRTAALLNKIMPVASGQMWSLFNRFPNILTKSVNADITVGQDSRSEASNSDHNFPT